MMSLIPFDCRIMVPSRLLLFNSGDSSSDEDSASVVFGQEEKVCTTDAEGPSKFVESIFTFLKFW